jgi:hypothetical protein
MIIEIINDIGSDNIKSQDDFINSINSYINGGKLNTIIKDFWDYRNNNKKIIENKYPKLFKQLSFFFLFLYDIKDFVEEFYQNYSNKDEIKYRINVCLKLYYKALQTFIDIFGLLENGSIVNTYILWRSIYENYVVTLYLIDGSENEAKLFNEYVIIQKNKLSNKTPSKEEIEKYIQIFGSDYKNDYCWAQRIKGMKTFKSIVEFVKEEQFYSFYTLSTYIGHSSSFSVNRKILTQDNTANTEMIGFFPDKVTHSVNLFLSTMTAFSKLIINKFIDEEYRNFIETLLDYFGVEIDKNITCPLDPQTCPAQQQHPQGVF